MPEFTHTQSRSFYDRFGAKQDEQAFYEDPATAKLIEHAGFESARVVVEFGCGTGRFAAKLLDNHLSADANYVGYDNSPTMIRLARERLAGFGDAAQVIETGGEVAFELADKSVDRVLANYVLDLLSGADIEAFLAEAHRVLRPGGRLCLTSLTYGNTLPSRIVSAVWGAVRAIRPSLVGGCRPIVLRDHLEDRKWEVLVDETIVTRGIPSEVLVAEPQ